MLKLKLQYFGRPAGWGALGGLAIPGGRGARRSRHVPGPEVSWGPRRPRDRQEPPRLKLRPLLLPSTTPGRDPDRLLPPFRHLNDAGGELAAPAVPDTAGIDGDYLTGPRPEEMSIMLI